MDCPTIPEFFAGKCVFVTGATGFLGKVLVEKLLRSCPDIERIYLLLRGKRGKDAYERLRQLTDNAIFDLLKQNQSSQLKKLVPLEGDVTQLGLGMSEEDRAEVIRDVTVVFHSAATVRFDEPLKQACMMNLRGTLEIIELCKEMKQLNVLVHVSTTYCNTHKPVIQEKLYPAPADWRQILKVCEHMDEHELDVLTDKILNGHSNTYTFTKALAEHAVVDCSQGLPVVICRPSIVGPTMDEPFPGWIDNFNGLMGFSAGAMKGVVRLGLSDCSVKLDMIPVDLVIKAILVLAWHKGVAKSNLGTDIPVFNVAASSRQDLSLKEILDTSLAFLPESPPKILWKPFIIFTTNTYIYWFLFIFLQILPAFLIDRLLQASNSKPLLMKITRKIYVASLAVAYFGTREWRFEHNKTVEIDSYLKQVDREAFSYDRRALSHERKLEYLAQAYVGLKKYLLREDPTQEKENKQHYQRMVWIHHIAQALFLFMLGFGMWHLKLASGLWKLSLLLVS